MGSTLSFLIILFNSSLYDCHDIITPYQGILIDVIHFKKVFKLFMM